MNNMKRGCRNNVSTSSRETTKFTTDYKICQFYLWNKSNLFRRFDHMGYGSIDLCIATGDHIKIA